MKKEPIDYLTDMMAWVLFLPITLTEKSKSKAIRVTGVLVMLTFVLTWIITGIPVLLATTILIIWQLIYEA